MADPKPEIIAWELLRVCRMPEDLVSENEYLRGIGPHTKSARRHAKDTISWGFLLRATDGLGMVKPHNNEKRKVRITRIIHKGQRAFDTYNLAGGTVKSVHDALRDLGWIKDDSPAWLDGELLQVKVADLPESLRNQYVKRKYGTVIEVYSPICSCMTTPVATKCRPCAQAGV